MNDRERLEAIVKVVRQYLPPDGIYGKEAMGKIIELVDPLPPKKQWVGLPDEKEIIEMSKDAWGRALLNYGRDDHISFYVAFARAIETYLKEKNQ